MQDDSLPSWLPRLAVQRGPRFLQIADALQAAVADGSLKPGDRLPPQRLLAAQLDVDLTTITRAYDEASGIKNPRIWTAERDMEMWKSLQA